MSHEKSYHHDDLLLCYEVAMGPSQNMLKYLFWPQNIVFLVITGIKLWPLFRTSSLFRSTFSVKFKNCVTSVSWFLIAFFTLLLMWSVDLFFTSFFEFDLTSSLLEKLCKKSAPDL